MEKFVRGTLRYLGGREEKENPRINLMFLWAMREVLKKNILDFSRSMEVLEASDKLSRMAFMVLASFTNG